MIQVAYAVYSQRVMVPSSDFTRHWTLSCQTTPSVFDLNVTQAVAKELGAKIQEEERVEDCSVVQQGQQQVQGCRSTKRVIVEGGV